MTTKDNNLIHIIGSDLFHHAKLALLFLLLNSLSALIIIAITYQTRLLIDQREQLILEHDKLNVEWRNLILEEEVLGRQKRVLRIATDQLKMRPVKIGEETIIIEK